MARQLLVESIRIDGRTQCRERINEETVAEYAEAMKAPTASGWPPIVVFFDGTEYWLADGFHRLLAAQRNGKKNIPADVKQGTREDAAWAACAANQAHGLRRTNADKRKAVEMALKLHPEMSDQVIANHCGVGRDLVFGARRQVVGILQPGMRSGADGKRYPVPPPRAKPLPAQDSGLPPQSEKRPGMAGPREEIHAVTGAATGGDEHAGPVAATSGEDGGARRKPRGICDDMGRRIPEERVALWNRRQEVQDMLTALSRVRVALRQAQDGRDLLFSDVPYSSALAHLDQAYDAVQVAKPYAVCAFCQGHGCQVCGQRGLLSKFRWDTAVPKEHKEAVARIITQEREA